MKLRIHDVPAADPETTERHIERLVLGPHCDHDDLCSMFGCDQRGHIDFPCKNQATCEFCGPTGRCLTNPDSLTSDCPDCYV